MPMIGDHKAVFDRFGNSVCVGLWLPKGLHCFSARGILLKDICLQGAIHCCLKSMRAYL